MGFSSLAKPQKVVYDEAVDIRRKRRKALSQRNKNFEIGIVFLNNVVIKFILQWNTCHKR